MKTAWRHAMAALVLMMANSCWAGLAEGKAAFEQQDYARALAEFRPLAARGNASAQFHLALMHGDGLGVPKVEAQAVQWYRKAAQQGLAVAQFNLGVAMQHGIGVAADPAAAVKWYRLAARQGQNNAQLNLGQAYFAGLGVSQDQAEAIKWYRRAAAQGNARAQYNLGIAHYRGQSVPVDLAQAFAWYLKAAQQRHPGAINNLGAMVNETPTLKQHRVIAYGLFSLSAELDPSGHNLASNNKAQLGASLSPKELAAGQAFARQLAQSDDLSTVLLAQLGGAPFTGKASRR